MKLGPVTALKNKNALMRRNALHKRWCTACILQLLLPWTGCFPVFQVAQSPIYTGLEHFLEWGKFSGQPVPVSHHPCSKGFLPATSLSPSSLSLQPGCLKTGSIPEPSIADRLCAQDIHCRSPGSWTFLSVRWELRHFLFLKLSVGQGPPTPLSSCFLLTPWLVHYPGEKERAASFADLVSTNTQHNHSLFLHPSCFCHHFSNGLLHSGPQPEWVNQSLLKVSKTVKRLLKFQSMFIQNFFKCETLMWSPAAWRLHWDYLQLPEIILAE